MARGEREIPQPAGDLDLSALDRALERIHRASALIGTTPPAPATTRGRLGAILVRVVQRGLFWLFPQLNAFNGAVAGFAEAQLAWMEELRNHVADLDEEVERLRELVAADAVTVGDEPPARSEGDVWLQIVRCQAGVESARQAIEGRG
jgi:hypothetical protein